MSILFYDILIRQVIGDGEIDGVDYVARWRDHDEMTIAILTFNWQGESGFLIFDRKNLVETQESINLFQSTAQRAEVIVGFNSLSFADIVCLCNKLYVETTYDLCAQTKNAAQAMTAKTQGKTSYSFNKIAAANGLPMFYYNNLSMEWQSGDRAAVVDACIGKIDGLKALFELGLAGNLIDPNTGQKLQLQQPSVAAAPALDMGGWAFLEELRVGSFVWIRRDEGDKFRDSIAIVSHVDNSDIALYQNVSVDGKTETVSLVASRRDGVVKSFFFASSGMAVVGLLMPCRDLSVRMNTADRITRKED